MDEEDGTGIEIITEPSFTYAMKINSKENKEGIFRGKTDGTEAVEQAVLKILNTERYVHEIYSWDYGIEIQDLAGQPDDYVLSELENRISEALKPDDRIEDIENFSAERTARKTIQCSFTVITTDGNRVEIDKEVAV
ncbi:MAG: DUF2634 domain-containing protein [Lachnospiraceae bacterium]|nr:DUF2634 domain-containing protein [Lachnospiraceae bacterium]